MTFFPKAGWLLCLTQMVRAPSSNMTQSANSQGEGRCDGESVLGNIWGGEVGKTGTNTQVSQDERSVGSSPFDMQGSCLYGKDCFSHMKQLWCIIIYHK